MPHALIIDHNPLVTRAVVESLSALGFDSFDHAWTEYEAIASADRTKPDLVILGDEVEQGSGLSAARQVSRESGAPVILITGDSFRARGQAAESQISMSGPFMLSEMQLALSEAQSD